MSIVVTGSAGFVGTHLVAHLRSRGQRVVGIDRRATARGDVRAELTSSEREVRSELLRADAVVHLAGCPGVRDRRLDVGRRRYRDNVAALREVLAVVPPGVPVIVASSSSVYGGSRAGRPSHEDDVLAPRGGYARSKVLAESVCRHARSAADVTVVRPFTVVGEGQRPDMALHRWVDAALAGRPLTVLGSLERTRDVTDVRDVAQALADLLERAPGGTVNLGSGTPVRLGAMVDAIAEVTSTEPVVRVEPVGHDEPADTLADVRRLVALTGRRPVTDLLDVVSRVRADLEPRVRSGVPA